jgi:hypothetical protein
MFDINYILARSARREVSLDIEEEVLGVDECFKTY